MESTSKLDAILLGLSKIIDTLSEPVGVPDSQKDNTTKYINTSPTGSTIV